MLLIKPKLRRFLECLSKISDVYVPAGRRFEKLQSATQISLGRKTLFSAKKLFLPSKEALMEFRGQAADVKTDVSKIVLFGVRPCDMNAIEYMDMVFKGDPYYMKRRNNMFIIGLQCPRPMLFDNCYCHCTNTFFANKYDLLFIETKHGFVAKAGSERGRRLLSSGFFAETADDPDIILGRMKEDFSRLTRGKPRADSVIDDKVIERLSEDCFSCTACTLVCPTCQSFTIEDEFSPDIRSGARSRLWDSCQLQRYTRVAGGAVFRQTRLQRVRQRIYCKFRYSKARDGMMSCTGCGRCVDVCTKGIDIFKVFK